MSLIPKVFIIILNYNGKNCLLTSIRSIFQLNYTNFEVVLVDNNSTDGSLEEIKHYFSQLVIIKNSQNIGFSAGNNIGIKYALERGADYVWLLNNDTQVTISSLSKLMRATQRNKSVGISSPTIIQKNTSRIWFSGGKINWLTMKSFHQVKKLQQDYLSSDFISGCAMLIKVSVFKTTGLLDEDYFLYWEDADFSVRAKKAGYQLLVSAHSQIYHQEKSNEQNPYKIYWLVLSGLLFFQKNTPFYLKPWISLYTLGRKIKNNFNLKYHKKSSASQVQKAYQDFKKNK